MNKKLLVVVVIGASLFGLIESNPELARSLLSSVDSSHQEITRAFEDRRSDVQVGGSGIVTRILSDDNKGSRHQRFILELPSGQSLLIAHNIDLAPRINGLRKGDKVDFYGEYEWNARGGVLHWTHHDPGGRHEAGWLKHKGSTYQ